MAEVLEFATSDLLYTTCFDHEKKKQYSLSTRPLKHRIINRNNLCSFNTQCKRPLGVYQTTSKKLASSLVFIQFCLHRLKYHIKKNLSWNFLPRDFTDI